jgi:two-component system response regulator FixJ
MEPPDGTLVVVDDDPEVQASIATLAFSMGLDCETFASVEDFLDHFEPLRTICVVADVRIGGMAGLQLQEHLARLDDTLPVILVTAYGSVAVAVRAMLNGALTVLEKPCDTAELANAIHRAIQIHQRMQAAHHRRAELQAHFGSLDPRERTVMARVVAGSPNKVIAHELGLSPRTVNRVRASVFKKMGAAHAVDLAQKAAELGKSEVLPVLSIRRANLPGRSVPSF